MGYRSEKQRPTSSVGRRMVWRVVATVSGIVLAGVTFATPLGAAPAKSPETAAASKPSSGTAASSRQESKRQPQTSSRAPADDKADANAFHGRRRGGSLPLDERSERSPSRAKPGVLTEVEGGTAGPHRPAREAKVSGASGIAPVKAPCVRDAIMFERGFGGDAAQVALTRCDGRPSSDAIEQLSILVRPMNVARPSALATRIRRAAHREWLPGVKRIHEGLVTRLQSVVDRFQAQKITLVSGYRPTSLGSFHQTARALDLHVEGVANEKLVEFCRTLPDTGCGYYPNSSFVHVDVRPAGTGHVYWIDASGPGEPARYVSSWPPKDSAATTSGIAPPDPAAPLDEQTHAGATRPPIGGSDTKIDARTTAPWWGGEGQGNTFAP